MPSVDALCRTAADRARLKALEEAAEVALSAPCGGASVNLHDDSKEPQDTLEFIVRCRSKEIHDAILALLPPGEVT